MKHLVLIILGLCLIGKPTHAQGLVPNGGDPISIEFLEIARTLLGIIAVKGEDQFPGLTVSAMLATVNDPQWKIQLGKDLHIEGVKKAALTYTEQKMTVVDEDMWNYVSLLPEAKKRKRAFVFHEVLVLMRLEVTNDYHLSSRLYGPEILQNPLENEILRDPSNGEKKIQTVGRLLEPGNSTVGIFAFVYVDQTVRYTFCENRFEPDTCRPLGNPNEYYKLSEIQKLYSDTKKNVKKMATNSSWLCSCNNHCRRHYLDISQREPMAVVPTSVCFIRDCAYLDNGKTPKKISYASRNGWQDQFRKYSKLNRKYPSSSR